MDNGEEDPWAILEVQEIVRSGIHSQRNQEESHQVSIVRSRVWRVWEDLRPGSLPPASQALPWVKELGRLRNRQSPAQLPGARGDPQRVLRALDLRARDQRIQGHDGLVLQ